MTGPGYQSFQSFQNITTHQNHLSSQRSHQDAVRTAQHAFDSSRRQAQYHHRPARSGGSAIGRLIGRVVSLTLLAFALFVAVEIAERAGVDLISLITDLF
jgi:hypothetical protein